MNKYKILYTVKNEYQEDRRSRILRKFYNELIDYIINELFEHNQLIGNKYKRDRVSSYLKNNKHDDQNLNHVLKQELLVLENIHFPTRDSRDTFDYLKILKLFGKIHFNYCEFYISNLNLNGIKCFFQDCKFHLDWTLYELDVLSNIDNVVYQTCEFHGKISNYTPENQKDYALINNSQFDYTCKFKKSIELHRCNLKSMLFNTNQNNYSQNQEIQKIIFQDSIFDKKLFLNNFNINEFHIKDSIFNDKFEFRQNQVKSFLIDNTNFEKISHIFECKFNKFKIYKSIFNDFVSFENCEFGTEEKSSKEIALFKYVTFLDFINFRNTNFKSGLDIESINTKEAPNFLNTNIEFKNTNRETFRIIKHSFERIDNHIEANKFFSQEMKKYKEELKKKPFRENAQEKIIFYLNDLISSYGQSYFKPIAWLIFFVIIYDLIIYSYNHNWLYKIYPPLNPQIQYFTNFLNELAQSILPFKKFLDKNLEFTSLIFYIIFSILIWQIIISIKRHTKR